MQLIDIICPHCGAQLKIDDANQKAVCSFCDSELLIEHQTVSSIGTAHSLDDSSAENLGYQFEKGRQRAQQEHNTFLQQPPASIQTKAPRKKRHIVWWVLGWIFIFPIPTTILICRNKKLNLIAKVAIIAIVWLVYLILVFSKK